MNKNKYYKEKLICFVMFTIIFFVINYKVNYYYFFHQDNKNFLFVILNGIFALYIIISVILLKDFWYKLLERLKK